MKVIAIHLKSWLKFKKCHKFETIFGHIYVSKAVNYTVRVFADGSKTDIVNQ
jgi:hypothetical protein